MTIKKSCNQKIYEKLDLSRTGDYGHKCSSFNSPALYSTVDKKSSAKNHSTDAFLSMYNKEQLELNKEHENCVSFNGDRLRWERLIKLLVSSAVYTSENLRTMYVSSSLTRYCTLRMKYILEFACTHSNLNLHETAFTSFVCTACKYHTPFLPLP